MQVPLAQVKELGPHFGLSPQSFSSDSSPQSSSWSHLKRFWMQRPLPQVNSSERHVLSAQSSIPWLAWFFVGLFVGVILIRMHLWDGMRKCLSHKKQGKGKSHHHYNKNCQQTNKAYRKWEWKGCESDNNSKLKCFLFECVCVFVNICALLHTSLSMALL